MAEVLEKFKLPPERAYPVVLGSWFEQVFLLLKRYSDEIGWDKGLELWKQHWIDRCPYYAERTLKAFKIEERDATAWAKYYVFIMSIWGEPGRDIEVIDYGPKRFEIKFTYPEGKCAAIRAVERLGIQKEINPGTVHCKPWTENSVKAINPKLEISDFKCIALGDEYCGSTAVLKE